MKNLFGKLLVLIVITLGLASCMKDDMDIFDSNEQFRLDSIAISDYVISKGLDAQRDPNTGIWYEIISQENAEPYTYKLKDTLGHEYVWLNARLRYEGKLLNGTTFDKFEADTGINMQIASRLDNFYPSNSTLIPAWIFTFVPKKIDDYSLNGFFTNGLQPKTKIRIITPSFWAYQNRPNGPIPANSPLEFIIDVIDIQDNKTIVGED